MMEEGEGDSNYYYNSTEEEDDDDLHVPLKKSSQDIKLWDTFQDPPTEESSASSVDTEWIETLTKLLKIFTYWLVFVVVAVSSVLSKLSFLFMTSHVADNSKIPFCDISMPEKQLVAVIPDEQLIAWRWAIVFAFALPECGAFIRSLRLWFFKSIRSFTWQEFGLVFIAETLHVLGLCLLAFTILPELDVIQGAMLTNCLCFIPSILCMLSRSADEPKRTIKYVLDIGSIAVQLIGFFIWPLTITSTRNIWFIPLSLFFISFHWWENFVTKCSPLRPVQYLAGIKDKLYESRYKIYIFISPYKILLFFAGCVILSKNDFDEFFANFSAGFGNHTIEITEVKPILSDKLPDFTEITSDLFTAEIFSSSNAIWWVLLTHVASSYICYIFGKFACKIHIQTFSFSLPINLTVPLAISALIIVCGLREGNICVYHDILPDYMFFHMPPVRFLFSYIFKQFAWIWVLWLFSQTWVTRHLWNPNSHRNASTEKLFVLPMYDSLIIDQSMVFNRRREEYGEFIQSAEKEIINDPETLNEIDAKAFANNSNKEGVSARDSIPQVFVCATMWHETKEELMEFLKSILRLDEDQCSRRMAMKYIQLNEDEIDKEYYDLETHIFFDDAFVGNKNLCESPEATPINSYVHLLVNILDEAAREVYKVKMTIPPPTKIVCPYGGRLVWLLPGRTKMIAHLKDKNKIRHKKRWSQVMYMYYLLGYRIMQLDASPERKMVIAQNTYLLALDGDIDFQPKAMHLLIDRMKIDPDLGAACGRIHPVGKGPMVWYQLFEYAIGHWLQKATEHVIGCVLCSPGCFSLFRGRALMENSVMKKYTTQSDQARHYVQYDQGEDRWLCTLILKQKYRVEYCAASDAYTHAPEGFNEFFNQRRRWVPSTMANIFDLLSDARRITKINNNISMPYIFYQIILMFGTIIGPGTIFLMMVSAILAVFAVDIYTAFIWNVIPLSVFMMTCYFCKQKYQLISAFIISIIYALIMMAVMVGVLIQVIEDGIMAPSSLFFITVAMQVIVTGLLHPQEITALPCGIIYYITIPCMYMLLTIYSLFNMNDVSWGTRENPQEATAAKVDEKLAKNQTKLQKFLGYLRPANDDEEGSFDVSFAGLFRCMFCTHKKVDTTNSQLMHIAASLGELSDKMKNLELKLTQDISIMQSDVDDVDDDDETDVDGLVDVPLLAESSEKQSNLLPDWLYDNDLKDGDTETISAAEEQFWVDLIEKYLKPLDMTPKDKEVMQDQLKALRDISVFAFTMGNALFVLVVFLLQLNKQYLHVRWPLNVKNNIIYDQNSFEILIQREYLNLEPISLLFVVFFGIVLFVQFIAMLFHRFATISQILATTHIDWYCSKRVKDTVSASELKEKAVEIARHLQRPRPEWEDDDSDASRDKGGKRDTIHRLLMQHKKHKDWSNLETNFKRELFKDGDLSLRRLRLTRKTVAILDDLRKSMAEYRRANKTGHVISPYFTSNESAYSVAHSNFSDKDSFSIYQRSTYQPSSPVPSVYVNGAPLRSALKKSNSRPTLSFRADNNIYAQGVENLSFVNDEEENFKDEPSNDDADEIEMYQRRQLSNDTSI